MCVSKLETGCPSNWSPLKNEFDDLLAPSEAAPIVPGAICRPAKLEDKIYKEEISVNGERERISHRVTVKQFLESKNINIQSVACELNHQVIRRVNLDQVELKPGDKLEILQMMGGG